MIEKFQRTLTSSFGILLWTVIFPIAAFAAEVEHEEPEMESLIWPAVNFVIYAAAMVYFYRRLAAPALVSRAEGIKRHIRKAAALMTDAERELEAVESRLANIGEEERAIQQRLAAEGAEIAATVLKNAEQTAAAIKKDVGRRVARELSQAQAEVRQQVIARAAELARGKLAKGLSADDDYRLRQQAIRGLL